MSMPVDTDAAQAYLREHKREYAAQAESPAGQAQIAEQFQLTEAFVQTLYRKRIRTDNGQMQG